MTAHNIVLHEARFNVSHEETVTAGCGRLRLRFCSHVITNGHKHLLDLAESVFMQTYNIVLHETSFNMSHEEPVAAGCGRLRLSLSSHVIADRHKHLVDLVVSVIMQRVVVRLGLDVLLWVIWVVVCLPDYTLRPTRRYAHQWCYVYTGHLGGRTSPLLYPAPNIQICSSMMLYIYGSCGWLYVPPIIP